MAKLTRTLQKIFGVNSAADQIQKFGSFAAGALAEATTPAQIQELSNYLDGWSAAVVGEAAPTIEDMNSLCYLFAWQLAYLFQAGIPEWETDTVYYIGSLVNDGTGRIYQSITDNNDGNVVTDLVNWKRYGLKGVASITVSDSPYTVPAGVDHVRVDASGGAVAITLPSAADVGRDVSVKKTDTSVNAVTVSSTLIDGATSDAISTPQESRNYRCYAANSYDIV